MGIVISKKTFVCLLIVSLYIVLDFNFEYVSVQGWCPMWLMSSVQASLISWGGSRYLFSLGWPPFIVRSVETGLGRLMVAVISVDAYHFLAFSDLTCHLEDIEIGVFWLHCAAW